jgi:hypothetical protein
MHPHSRFDLHSWWGGAGGETGVGLGLGRFRLVLSHSMAAYFTIVHPRVKQGGTKRAQKEILGRRVWQAWRDNHTQIFLSHESRKNDNPLPTLRSCEGS